MSLGLARAETSPGLGAMNVSAPFTCMIVEDRALIGMAVEAYLEEAGIDAHEPFASAADALEWLGTNTPSVAILDYSLMDGSCIQLARALRKRGIPFVIYSGHDRSIAPSELRGVPWLSNPCDRTALVAALIHVALPLRGASTQAAG